MNHIPNTNASLFDSRLHPRYDEQLAFCLSIQFLVFPRILSYAFLCTVDTKSLLSYDSTEGGTRHNILSTCLVNIHISTRNAGIFCIRADLARLIVGTPKFCFEPAVSLTPCLNYALVFHENFISSTRDVLLESHSAAP